MFFSLSSVPLSRTLSLFSPSLSSLLPASSPPPPPHPPQPPPPPTNRSPNQNVLSASGDAAVIRITLFFLSGSSCQFAHKLCRNHNSYCCSCNRNWELEEVCETRILDRGSLKRRV
ncbi:E3 ubiquitin-protein ligase RNF19B-like [Trifolium pratense]|uniref:E3 ubiquitin-protein ligase RNF19B-like n=1 Tax=Trifolium pratense TaxID=57577 RepID=UPI001E69378D|nr:E3 ubiquitin-protein ligase RNF19B-like [Trifolium pratense]